jgi:hypothetical protein
MPLMETWASFAVAIACEAFESFVGWTSRKSLQEAVANKANINIIK